MRTSSHAPFYDLFKLIVAIILLIIFLFLILTRPGQSARPPSFNPTQTPLPPTPTVAPPTQTSIPLTVTPEPTETQTITETPVNTPTAETPPTTPPTDEPLPTPIVEIPSEPEACAAYSRTQLQVGMQATIQRRLNFRSYPGLFNNLILTNDPNTEVEIVGGPECTRYEKGGAYLWWEIKLPNGLTGWSAEASAFGAFYFMEPNE
jgi:hypothetical protein